MADSYWSYRGQVMIQARNDYAAELPPFIQENMACPKGHKIKVFRVSGNLDKLGAWRRELSCRQWDNHGTHKFWTYTKDGERLIVKAFSYSPTEVAFYEWIGAAGGEELWNQWEHIPGLYLSYHAPGFNKAFRHLEEFPQLPKRSRRPYQAKRRAENQPPAVEDDGPAQRRCEELERTAGHGRKPRHLVEAEVAIGQRAVCPAIKRDESDEEPLLHTLQRLQGSASSPPQSQSMPPGVQVAGAAYLSPYSSMQTPADSLAAHTSVGRTPFTPSSTPGVSSGTSNAVDCYLSSYTLPQDQARVNDQLRIVDSSAAKGPAIPHQASNERPGPANAVEGSPPGGNSARAKDLPLPQASPPTATSETPESAQTPGIAQAILDHTTFYISLSSNAFGAVPVKLSSCPTIGLFYASIAASWDISEVNIEAVSVRLAGQTDTDALVVKREVPDSYLELLEVIEDAHCWANEQARRKKCHVKITVHMKETTSGSGQRKRKERAGSEELDERGGRVIKLE